MSVFQAAKTAHIKVSFSMPGKPGVELLEKVVVGVDRRWLLKPVLNIADKIRTSPNWRKMSLLAVTSILGIFLDISPS